MDFEKEALIEAGKSTCKKRKVGAVMVKDDVIVGRGHNYNTDGYVCEDAEGNTYPTVIHAEIAAIASINTFPNLPDLVCYVTHEPCSNCKAALAKYDIKYIVVKKFMKFDSGKLRYSLVPPVAIKAIASVLTYGAKKYKPNNWQEVDDINRYWDALYRHLESARSGELLDPESKLPHLWHAITNIGFLIWFNNKNVHNGPETSQI